jgi:hypothetical protein
MSRRIIANFEREGDLLRATHIAREHGCLISDTFAPYAVHGLDEAMGLRRSRLPVACFLSGLIGVVIALWFQYWSTAWDWPVNVGGRPWNSLPAFIPVTFEMMVLFSGLGVVLAWLIVCRLYPGKKPACLIPRVTDDRFSLVVNEPYTGFNAREVEELLRSCNAVGVQTEEGTAGG